MNSMTNKRTFGVGRRTTLARLAALGGAALVIPAWNRTLEAAETCIRSTCAYPQRFPMAITPSSRQWRTVSTQSDGANVKVAAGVKLPNQLTARGAARSFGKDAAARAFVPGALKSRARSGRSCGSEDLPIPNSTYDPVSFAPGPELPSQTPACCCASAFVPPS